MTTRLLRLSAQCPKCGKRPALRITIDERDLAGGQSPDKLKQTIQCQSCGTRYAVTAKDFQGAA